MSDYFFPLLLNANSLINTSTHRISRMCWQAPSLVETVGIGVDVSISKLTVTQFLESSAS